MYKRQVESHVPPDLLAPFDGVLMEQVLVNLLENAAKYTGCLLYTSDAADERSSVDLGGRRIIKKKKRGERMR